MKCYPINNYYDYIFQDRLINIDKVIVVSHTISTTEDFLISLNDNIGIALLIPKLSSLQDKTYNKLKMYIPMIPISKEELEPNNLDMMKYLKKIVGDECFAIIDVGGYFSHILKELNEEFEGKLAGIVEDTENGLNKYQSELSLLKNINYKLSYSIVSVARSPLKECEDYMVGKEIALKSEIYLSKKEYQIFGRHILVLGFGKIGRSAAVTFRERGAYVSVIDTDPIRQALALSYGFSSGVLSEKLNKTDIIICATGNHCIGWDEIRNIRERNVYCFSVTSPDDEFNNYDLISSKGIMDKYGDLIVETLYGGNMIFVHNGAAINFKETRSLLSNVIRLVLSEICEAVCTLDSFPMGVISEISDERRAFLAQRWLESYE